MKILTCLRNACLLTVLVCVTTSVIAQNSTDLRNIPFDEGWSFKKTNVASGPEKPGYDVSDWRTVEIPHDWSIEDLPNQIHDSVIGPFQKGDYMDHQVGYTIGGIGWYSKKFITEKSLKNKHVVIHFDGVYLISDVWINGCHLGTNSNGYSPFYYDLTKFLKPVGQENVLTVKVKNEGDNSRWYSGSGIYRHVWLSVTDKICIDPWGVYITTPQITDNKANIRIKTAISNKQIFTDKINLVTTILSPTGKIVQTGEKNIVLDFGTSQTIEQDLQVSNPDLWSPDAPQLYKAITEIKKGKKVLDKVETKFGIRSLSFSAQKGFLLNGEEVILKGGCIHHDNGPLGAKAIARAEVRKIELMKQNGFNAVRTSHNPFSEIFMNACDSIGMLVINEAFDMWNQPKNKDDYSKYFKKFWNRDLTNLMLRDRNHPSVIMWSIGNEIPMPERYDSAGLITRKMLVDRFMNWIRRDQ
ncbi:MAG: hypothetical protein JKX79_00020 [Labilibaculum sp.]|nr:hypothetical protein [Labilibaculum sp.]